MYRWSHTHQRFTVWYVWLYIRFMRCTSYKTMIYIHVQVEKRALTWQDQFRLPPHIINGIQWKRSTDHPGFVPETFGWLVWCSTNWATCNESDGEEQYPIICKPSIQLEECCWLFTKCGKCCGSLNKYVMWSEKTHQMMQNWYFESLVSYESLSYSLSRPFYLDLLWYWYQKLLMFKCYKK